MMKCTDIQKHLDDYLDDVMSLGEQKATDAHIKQCTSCQQSLDENKVIRLALSSIPVDEASADFEAKVFSAVRNHHFTNGRDSGSKFFAGFMTAVVASLALWFVSTAYTPQFGETSPQIINLAMSQTRTVKLIFDVPADLTDVTLSVQLPENIELEGYAGQKQLVWQANLTKGQNILALPVTAIRNGQGELVAKLHYGDKTKQFYIVLKTASDGALIYQINNLKSA